MRKQRAAIAPLQSQSPQVRARHLNMGKQLARRQRDRLPVTQLLQYNCIAAALQAGKYLVEKSHFFELSS
jgi:hypothetical protein